MGNNNTSLRNEIDYDLHYVMEDGTEGIKRLHISFISMAIYKSYQELVNEAREAVMLGEKIKNTTASMGTEIAKHSKLEGDAQPSLKDTKSAIDAIKREYDDAVARITEIANHTYEKKFALIEKILRRNNVEDKELYSLDWWTDNTSMHSMMDFIHTACTKDDALASNKKKR